MCAILLVEDSSSDVELLLRALSKLVLADEVCVVRDGAEALDYVFATGAYAERNIRDCPRVILLDLKLPKVDGLDVLRAIKSDERTKHIPIVVLTSSAEDRDVLQSYQLGANSYIVKPVSFKQFTDSVVEAGHYWLRLNKALC